MWTKQEEAKLGTGPDEAVARQIKRTFLAVRYRRSQLGIPVFGGIGFKWSAAQDRLLRLHTAKAVARRLGISMTMVYWRRNKLGIAGLLPWKAQGSSYARHNVRPRPCPQTQAKPRGGQAPPHPKGHPRVRTHNTARMDQGGGKAPGPLVRP